jgi:hypothetical protein
MPSAPVPREPFFRRLRARGGSGLNPALAWLLAVWSIHAVLRTFMLFRNDSYGFPIVGKPDWYIFHAFCVDWLWIGGWSLPFLAIAAAAGALGKARAAQGSLAALMAFHVVMLPFTVIDHETMRFLGMHLDLSLLSTYGNVASIREVFKFVASDESVRYLPYVLVFGCVPAAFGAYAFLKRRRWAASPRLGRAPLVLAGIALFAWVFLNLIWTGGFRLR